MSATDADPDSRAAPEGIQAGPAAGVGERAMGRGWAVFAVVASFALLATACAITGVLAWRDIRATADVVDARQARRSGTLALEAIMSAESETRGFLLMREPTYLAPYAHTKSEFSDALTELRARLPDRPGRPEQIAAAARIGGNIFGELDQAIALGEAGRYDNAVTLLRAGRDETELEELRRIMAALTADANGAVERTTETQSWLSTSLVAAIIFALLCVAGFGLLLLNNARLHWRMLTAREISARRLAETLEQRVAERTRELALVNQRFDAALRASGVTVMTQDRDLVFTWISRGVFGRTAAEIVGRPQHEVIPEPPSGVSATLKRAVLETGEPARGDVRVAYQGQETWYDLMVHPLRDEQDEVVGTIAAAVDITRYKEQQAHIRLLMRELTHRSKNLLTVIQAIMRQTADNSVSLEDFQTRFAARLQSLAGSHDLLVRDDWQGASLREIVRSQLGHYNDQENARIALDGDPLRVGADAAQHIGMALHELATNAAKYGALSVPDGKVGISWQVTAADGEPTCQLRWEENGGPAVAPPSRRGFGRIVIERVVARALNGQVKVDYAPAGLRWTLTFPVGAAAGGRPSPPG